MAVLLLAQAPRCKPTWTPSAPWRTSKPTSTSFSGLTCPATRHFCFAKFTASVHVAAEASRRNCHSAAGSAPTALAGCAIADQSVQLPYQSHTFALRAWNLRLGFRLSFLLAGLYNANDVSDPKLARQGNGPAVDAARAQGATPHG